MPSEIELHPGHWKHTGSGANGIINEVTEARRVTKRVYEILKASKVPCTYFEDNTSTNQRQNLNTLVQHHNRDLNGLVTSIHFNSSGAKTSKGIGVEVLYKTQKELSVKLAKAISDASGLINRGAKYRDNLAVLNNSKEPAIIIEVCFVNSVVDTDLYRRDFEKICQAIANVLAEHIGKSIVPEKEEKKVAERDIHQVSDWAAEDWKEACENGYFDGSRPGAPITREEMAIVVNRIRHNFLALIKEEN
jgi:N-acetylmuramoyl-L-alanine amidase